MGWTIFLVVCAAVVAVGLYVIYAYNALVTARQRSQEAWSGIDVQLKRRSNLVPNLVETVKGYAGHEKDLLEEVTQMRSKVDHSGDAAVDQRAAAEGQLGGALIRLMAVAENYPALRASENFQALQTSLDEIERDIQHARRYYNGAARMQNIRVQSFPSNLIATRFGFDLAQFFELDSPDERQVPAVSF
ncbi:LemA family protein [Paracoccus sp. M683]|uniref:LemA family protein n=1 Tax=Paracoccus sp. M683 TaxID=2594268 RepID=UPI00117E5D7D|nr:LemA family protein [Paracoccus sp. M683]TRW98677.1 LemA family protein [Paracoccus sp. M683]